MEKIVHVSGRKTAVFYLVILMAFGFLGCTMEGRVVQIDNQILFGKEEKRQGIFTQRGLTVDYSYQLSGGNINLAGEVSFSDRVDSLNVHLLFLNDAGTVLVQKIIYSSGYRDSSSWKLDRSFQHTFIVPTGTKGISFSYSSSPYRGRR